MGSVVRYLFGTDSVREIFVESKQVFKPGKSCLEH
jgi:hypothetical protein